MGGMKQMKHGKKYSDSLKLIDHLKQYDPEEAVDLVVQRTFPP